MNETFNRGMARAARLTQAGKLTEATALLQKVLRGELAQGEPTSAPKAASAAPPLFDVTPIDASQGAHRLTAMAGGSADNAKDAGPRRSGLRSLLDRLAPKRDPASRGVFPKRAKPVPSDIVPPGGQFIAKSFSNVAGARAYKLYIPKGHEGPPCPLVVMLHGCTQSPDDFAAGTRMNVCAEEHGCFVVYPEQTAAANPSKCWNWFRTADQVRDQGEPSIIAGLTREVMKNYRIDPRRIYVAGLSAGGAAAAVMGEAYPDLYAAVGVHSGLAFGAASDMPSAFAAMSGKFSRRAVNLTTKAIVDGKFVPTIVFHGDRDATVHPRNGADVIARATSRADLQSLTENASAAGRSYTRAVHRDARGRAVIEEWIIHGAGHAWSGGSSAGSYADPKGPDASREMLRFFLALGSKRR